MLHYAGDEVIRHLGHPAAVGIFAIGRIKQISAGLAISQRHVVVRATAGAVGRRLGHKAGKATVLAGNLVGHQTEENQAVSHAESVGVGEVGFELAVGVFVVEGVHIPAHGIHGFDQLAHNRHVVHQAARVITGFGEGIASTDRLEPAIL